MTSFFQSCYSILTAGLNESNMEEFNSVKVHVWCTMTINADDYSQFVVKLFVPFLLPVN